MSQNQKNITIIVVIAVTLGLVSGMVGALVARVYVLDDIFNIPFYGEIDFSNMNYNSPSVVIRGARKVVVEQDTKVNETIVSTKNSIVGIYGRIEEPATTTVLVESQTVEEINISKYYNIDDLLGQGFIITSDGWILTTHKPVGLDFVNQELTEKQIAKVAQNYVIISSDKEIYLVDNIVYDSLTDYYFWHIKAQDLPVKRFVPNNEINVGQIALVINNKGWGWLTTIIGKEETQEELVRSSDQYLINLFFGEEVNSNFYNSFLLNLNGDLMGIINQEGIINSINNFKSAINGVLTNQSVARASLGVNYMELSLLVGDNNQANKGAMIAKNKKGIAVIKGSVGQAAGLQEDDIITHVNNIELDSTRALNSQISEFMAGEEIELTIVRAGKIFEKQVKLDKL
ncbi:S1C family serine protease [Patescibacteria group bacterium]